jgi:urocanate hydratase
VVYQKYLLLQSLAARRHNASLAGALVVTSGMGREGMELAMASTIAGAAFLGMEPRPQRLKSALRHCACDFMVNTLDEALRVLKNELRRGQPISVGLLGNAAELLPQMVERGVQPDFLSDTSPLNVPDEYIVPASLRTADGDADFLSCRAAQLAAILRMTRQGAVLVAPNGALRAALTALDGTNTTGLSAVFPSALAPASALGPASAPGPLNAAGPTYSLVRWTGGGLQDMKRLDALAASLLPPDDAVRLRWLEGVAGCFHRQTPLERVLSLQPEERTALLGAIQRPSFRNTLEHAMALHWQDARGEEHTLHLPSEAPAHTTEE